MIVYNVIAKPITFDQSDPSFQYLVTFCCEAASFGYAINATNDGIAKKFDPKEVCILEGSNKVYSNELFFYPSEIFNKIIVEHSWPITLTFYEQPISDLLQQKTERTLDHSEMNILQEVMVRSTFLFYFESKIETRFPSNAKATEPSLIRFARVVRNAFTHDGFIDWRDKNALPVQWQNITYDVSQHKNKRVMDDIQQTEIIWLMRDLDGLVK